MASASITPALVKELSDAAAAVVEMCKRAGADASEVLVRDGTELTAKVRMGEPELVQEFAKSIPEKPLPPLPAEAPLEEVLEKMIAEASERFRRSPPERK